MIPGGVGRVRYSGPYPESDPLAHSLDDAIAAANKIAAARTPTPQEEARLALDTERWAAVRAARNAAGPHAVVLPIATAIDVLNYLDDGRDEDPLIAPGLLARMIEAAFPDRLT